MNKLTNPHWIIILSVIPLCILFLLGWNMFDLINTDLDPENLTTWKVCAAALGAIIAIHLGCALYFIKRASSTPLSYALAVLLSYIPTLYILMRYGVEMFPREVASWMLPQNALLYISTLIMPTLLHAVYLAVLYSLKNEKKNALTWSIIPAVLIPIAWYVLLNVFTPLWRLSKYDFLQHFFFIALITTTVLFYFFLVRAVYILFKRKSKYGITWSIFISLIFPLLGLALNDGYIFDLGGRGFGIFGEFKNHWFYILTVINAVIICYPINENTPKNQRLFLFFAKAVTFSYTSYFMLVFLPFLPLSIVGIIAFGLGFLMLAPIVLFLLQSRLLYQDVLALRAHIRPATLSTLFAIGFLSIPTIIFLNCLNDKMVIQNAVNYAFNSQEIQHEHMNTAALRRSLKGVKEHKNETRLWASEVPYISALYKRIVLDNMTITQTKIERIERIFFGEELSETSTTGWRAARTTARTANTQANRGGTQTPNVVIRKHEVNSSYDAKTETWTSWLDLELENKNNSAWQSEYITRFNLPKGCYISDYYLHVLGEKKHALLVEKKAALWIYNQIVSTRKDPGLLYYTHADQLTFRIFPFAKEEIRKSGIQFCHKEPVTLVLDGKEITLGNMAEQKALSSSSKVNGALYIPASVKSQEKSITREATYRFIVDCSKHNTSPKEDIINRIEKLITDRKLDPASCSIALLDSQQSSYPYTENWKEALHKKKNKSGFFLDRSLRQLLNEQYTKSEAQFPIQIVVSPSLENALVFNHLKDIAHCYPDHPYFYHLTADGSLNRHSLSQDPVKVLQKDLKEIALSPVIAWKLENGETRYIAADQQPGIIYSDRIEAAGPQESPWQAGLELNAKWIQHKNQTSSSNENWLNIIKQSFASKVMCPATSFIVVETESQEKMLLKKQKEALQANQSFDFDDRSTEMSEPGLIILLLFGAGLYGYDRRRKKLSRN